MAKTGKNIVGQGVKSPASLAMVLLGMAGAIAALICLFTLDFTWIDLAFYIPGLGLSALLVFGGIGRSRVRKR